MDRFSMRALAEADAGLFQKLRLRAIEEEPASSPDTLYKATTIETEAVRALLGNKNNMVLAESSKYSGTICATRHGLVYVIWGLYVDPSFRRRGLASSLLEEMCSRIQPGCTAESILFSEVNPENHTSWNFFIKRGFRIAGSQGDRLLQSAVRLQRRIHPEPLCFGSMDRGGK